MPPSVPDATMYEPANPMTPMIAATTAHFVARPSRRLGSVVMSSTSLCMDASLSQLRLKIGGNVVDGRVLAPLERPDIGDDGPPVVNGNLRAVGRHVADAVGDGVEEVPVLPGANEIGVERGRRRPRPLLELIGTLSDHTVAVARQTMAWRAVDLVALPASFEQRHGHRDRVRLDPDIAVDLAQQQAQDRR